MISRDIIRNNINRFPVKKNIISTNDSKKRVAVVVLDKLSSNIILVEQAESLKWGIPKGHLHHNESIWDGAIRELYEETNLSLNNISFKLISRKKSLYIIQLLEEFDQLKPDLKEISKVKWSPLTEVKDDVKKNPKRYNTWIRMFINKYNHFLH
jgi:ADP-ribose pyrophosphatase YjhB (NUDIX family)